MACRSKRRQALTWLAVLTLLIIDTTIIGCISLRFEKGGEGRPLPETASSLEKGKSTLTEVLQQYGAPFRVFELADGFAVTYECNGYRGLSLSMGLPVTDATSTGMDMTAYGSMIRYDTFMIFFTKEGILHHYVLEKGSRVPLWKTYWRER